MSKFFTADPHLNHKNIIKYCNRPFADIYEHDKTILANLNGMAQENDELYIAGDFCFGNPQKYLDQIICKNIFFIVGSHDKDIWGCKSRFRFIGDRYKTEIDGIPVVIMHECPLVWPLSHHGSIALYGHSHGRLGNSREGTFSDEYQKAIALILSRAKSMDIGVDTYSETHKRFSPYTWEEIKEIMSKKQGFLVNKDR